MAKDEVRSQQWIDRIEELVHQAEALADPQARSIAIDLIQAVLDFHAAGLERIMEISAASSAIAKRLVADDLISSLLLLHDLHPDDLETRIARAMDKLQAAFHPLGARLSLISIEGGTVRLQFESSRTWPAASVKTTVENEILQGAPEVSAVIIEGIKEAPAAGFVPLANLAL
jgi:hypothetical protein